MNGEHRTVGGRGSMFSERAEFIKQNEDALVTVMIQRGGGFAASLGLAWQRADLGNRYLLRSAFGDLLYTYRVYLPQQAIK